MLNKEQLEEYLRSAGTTCPFCHKQSVEQVSSQPTQGAPPDSLFLSAMCIDCKKSWTEVYKLCNVINVIDMEVIRAERVDPTITS